MPKDFCDGTRFKALLGAGVKQFNFARDYIDSISIFPAHSGDTGTNLYQTFVATLHSAKATLGRDAGVVIKNSWLGSFLGSRGHTGFIFALFLLGFSESSQHKNRLYATDLVDAFLNGAKIVTEEIGQLENFGGAFVINGACMGAQTSSGTGIAEVLSEAYAGSKKALVDYTTKIEAFNQAGVQDAGGLAFCLLLLGMLRYSRAEAITSDLKGLGTPVLKERPPTPVGESKFRVEFMLEQVALDVKKIRDALRDLGDGLLLVRGPDSVKIHLNSLEPKKVFDRTSRFGKPSNIKVDDLARASNQFLKRPKEGINAG